MLKQLTKGLTRKVTLASIVILALFALIGAFVLLSVDATLEASGRLSNEILPQLDAKGDFTTSMARMLGELEASLRGGGADDLTNAQQEVDAAQDALARLHVEATDGDESTNPEEIAANQRILERETAILKAAQRLVADVSASNAAPAEQVIAEIDQLRVDLAALEDESDALLGHQSTEATGVLAASVQSVFIGAGALLVLCIAVVLLVLFLLRRTIVRPVIALADAAQDVAGGHLDQTVLVSSGDEIGTLQRSFNTMVGTLQQQTQQLQQQLETANTAQAAAEAARAGIAEQLRTIEEQRAVIREMSVPILPLSKHALVMPLVGALDTARLRVAMERVLQTIQQGAVRYALLDVTGVPLIDSHVARGLFEIIRAARLLGTEVVVVGIRPEVAQAIVGLGIQFDQFTVRSTLQDGIAYVLSPR